MLTLEPTDKKGNQNLPIASVYEVSPETESKSKDKHFPVYLCTDDKSLGTTGCQAVGYDEKKLSAIRRAIPMVWPATGKVTRYDLVGGDEFFKHGRAGQRVLRKELRVMDDLLKAGERIRNQEFDTPGDLDQAEAELDTFLSDLRPETRVLFEQADRELAKMHGRSFNTTGKYQIFPLPGVDISPSPSSNGFRDVKTIFGGAGSGKSTWVVNYANEWYKMYHGPIWIFSRLRSDPILDEGIRCASKHGPHRWNMDPDHILSEEGRPTKDGLFKGKPGPPMTQAPFEVKGADKEEEPRNVLVIFDDCNTIVNPEVRDMVEQFRDDCLETGRHENIFMAITSHEFREYKRTKKPTNEAQALVICLKNSPPAPTIQFIIDKIGLTRPQTQRLLQVAQCSHWLMITRTVPQVAIWQQGIRLLSSFVQ